MISVLWWLRWYYRCYELQVLVYKVLLTCMTEMLVRVFILKWKICVSSALQPWPIGKCLHTAEPSNGCLIDMESEGCLAGIEYWEVQRKNIALFTSHCQLSVARHERGSPGTTPVSYTKQVTRNQRLYLPTLKFTYLPF